MENLDLQEQQLLEQLNIVRKKKETQKKQFDLQKLITEQEQKLNALEDNIKSKKAIYYQLQKEIPDLEYDMVMLKDEIKQLKNNLEPIVEIQPIVEEIVLPEPIIEEEANLNNMTNAKRLSHNELNDMKFWSNGFHQDIQMNQIQVGDVVFLCKKGYGRGFIAYITRKTDKTLFYKCFKTDASNKILHYDWKINGYNERSYTYYLVDLQNINNYLAEGEGKISIKNGKTMKATKNFVLVDELDWGA
jgi:hypothetical protein